MAKNNQNKIMLFIGKNSNYFRANIDNFRDIVLALSRIKPIAIEVIDVSLKPELTHKYKIDALPTLIIGNMRYIGEPSQEKAVEIFKRGII